ncbi:MAG: hypothetical protein ACKV2T_36990 [Kofleriaceae bacterium]
MRPLLIIIVALLAGCPRTLSESDRAALQDFRTVERACLARAAEILRDDSIHLSDVDDLVTSIKTDLLSPWQAMRTRVKLEDRKFGDELAAVLRRYFDEREVAWSSLAKAIGIERSFGESQVNHRWQFRESNDAAEADRKIIEQKLVALKLPPLPPVAAPAIVELDPPPPNKTPGAAYFFVARSVVRLDDTGFRTIATNVDTMDVLPDGRMWACSNSRLVFWDGARHHEYPSEIPASTCAAAPDGSVWVLEDRYYDDSVDRLGHFNGKKWTITTAAIGEPSAQTESLLTDREGRLYALNHGGFGGDHVFIRDKTWRRLALQDASESSYINHLHRGEDGHVWATYQIRKGDRYPAGFARLQPAGGDSPAFVADYFQQEELYPFIDAAGVFTVLDPRRNVIEQAKKTLKLRLPVAHDRWDHDNRGPIAFDGAGRIWVDLVDGINVIEHGGRSTVYPRGSVPGIHQNIETIVVVGGGPTLVPPGPVETRTITGKLRDGGKLEFSLCADAGRECVPGLPHWTATSDAEGAFTFENIPRWKMSIQGLVGISGDKVWRSLNVMCCADKTDLGEITFQAGAIY